MKLLNTNHIHNIDYIKEKHNYYTVIKLFKNNKSMTNF